MKILKDVGTFNGKKRIKKIKNPSIWQLAISLIPLPILGIAVIIMRAIPTWFLIVGGLSVVTYMALTTYFCIKQKCYFQLFREYLVLVTWIIIFVLQFIFLPHFLK